MGPGVNVGGAAMLAQEDAEERQLNAARDAFPAWRIVEVRGGFAAVHSEAVYLDAASLDGLVAQLRQQ